MKAAWTSHYRFWWLRKERGVMVAWIFYLLIN